MKMRKLCLFIALAVGCARGTVYTRHNPATGKPILWPSEWAPEGGPVVRGDALPAMQAALTDYLRKRTRLPNAWEGRCEDAARAMDVSYMVDERQHLVFVKIDEVPEKRCPDGAPIPIHLEDGGTGSYIPRPMAPMTLDGVDLFAVTPEGQVLDVYREGDPESFHPHADVDSSPGGDGPTPDGGTPDGGMSDGGGAGNSVSG